MDATSFSYLLQKKKKTKQKTKKENKTKKRMFIWRDNHVVMTSNVNLDAKPISQVITLSHFQARQN